MDMISTQKGWAEQQPELWWRYLCLGTKKILKKNKVDVGKILSIGISYQMHGLVIVDKELQVLRPSIIWCDSRAVSIGERAFDDLGHKFCLENFQNSPGNFTASKLKWVKDNEPEVYSRIYKMMLPGDYIAMKLTGKISTTVSGLSEGILWNFKEGRIANELLDYFGISPELIPEILPTFSKTGELSSTASEETGLKKGTSVSYRAGDQPNNALSLNVLKPGEIGATSGTSGVVYGVVDQMIYDNENRVNAFAHVNHLSDERRIGVLLCINGAGIQYSWLRSQVARSNRTYDDMERMLSSVAVGSEGLRVLPFGNGAERMFNNTNLESHIKNIEFNRHTRAHLYRASLEGVAFAFVHGISILKEMGLDIKKLKVGNDNMFRSTVFSTTIATLLDININVIETTGAVGAALASGYGFGFYDSIHKVMENVRPLKIYKPASNSDEYHQAYNYWKLGLNELIDKADASPSFNEQSVVSSKLLAQQNLLLESQSKKLEDVKQLLLRIKNGDNINVQSEVTKMIYSINNSLVGNDKVFMHIDFLDDPYINRIRTAFPLLSYEELKLCYYLKLKFTTKEIADKLNLSYRGTETKRYRLRKKLNVATGTNLIAYLDAI